jgi:hypothetical protein
MAKRPKSLKWYVFERTLKAKRGRRAKRRERRAKCNPNLFVFLFLLFLDAQRPTDLKLDQALVSEAPPFWGLAFA